MSTTHTPGPWHRNIKPAAKYTTIFAGRNTHVAHLDTIGLTPEAIEGNCDLIAAAPEMLESLRELVAENYGQPSGVSVPALDKARRVIAKAEGRTT